MGNTSNLKPKLGQIWSWIKGLRSFIETLIYEFYHSQKTVILHWGVVQWFQALFQLWDWK